MNIPNGEDGRKLRDAVRSLRGYAAFNIFTAWIETARNRRDVENRAVGYENRTSEAEALTVVLRCINNKSANAEGANAGGVK